MQIVFKASGDPQPGDLFIRPATGRDAREKLALASLVLTHGIEALDRGAGPCERIIVLADSVGPTLDDMLAATFASMICDGKTPGDAALALARYAGMARQGLQPSDLPLEESIEGIYLAIRNDAQGDLSSPAAASRFLANWQRMATELLAAIESGSDPFKTALFGGDAFARERAFLRKDQDVYRQDVLRGQRLSVSIPGGPPTGSALVLNEPKSLLFKYWARRDAEAPAGGMYSILAVRWGSGKWVFSTDPVQRLSLKSLADALDAAEIANKTAAAGDPWFDGAPFDYTIVAAPHNGTKLSDEQVLKTFKTWSHAHGVSRAAVTRGGGAVRWTSAAAAILLLAAAVILGVKLTRTNHPTGEAVAIVDHPAPVITARGSISLSPEQTDELLNGPAGEVPKFALIMGVGQPNDQAGLPALEGACKGAVQFYRLLIDTYKYRPENIKFLVDRTDQARGIRVDGPPTRDGFMDAVYSLEQATGAWEDQHKLADPNDPTPSSQFIFYYGGHGVEDPLKHNGGYLAFSGLDPNRTLESTGFEMGELYGYLRKHVRSPHQMIILDCCLSGFGIISRGDEEKDSSIHPEWSRSAHAIVTAGTSRQNSFDVDNEPFFTAVLCEGLRPGPDGFCPADDDKNGIVTDEELAYYLKHAVRQQIETRNLGRTLTPQYWHAMDGDSGQFLMIPKVGKAKE